MKISKQQLRKIIRESLPYRRGQPWTDPKAPVRDPADREEDHLDRELADDEIEAAMGWERADPAGDDDFWAGYGDATDGKGLPVDASPDYKAGWEDGNLNRVTEGAITDFLTGGLEFKVAKKLFDRFKGRSKPKEETEEEAEAEDVNEVKISRRQIRQIIREAMGDDFFSDREANPHDGSMYGEPEGGYGSTAEMKDDGSYFRDVIVMSPNGDSVLVDGSETYVDQVPHQLELMGFPMSDIDADNLIFALEESMADGYVELMITYEDGIWSW